MKFFLSLFLLLSLSALAKEIKVATFDSGFGGYFTAKEIERAARKLSQEYGVSFSVTHYGDTKNAPYGEKQPTEIAGHSARGISRALRDGAESVFIACNTASTQYEAILRLLGEKHPGPAPRIYSIIESSVNELKRQVEERLRQKNHVRVLILATPFTIKSMVYPDALARAFNLSPLERSLTSATGPRWYKQKGERIETVSARNLLTLPGNKKIELIQLGPGNWVDMIEHAAPEEVQRQAVAQDLRALKDAGAMDVVAEFCTHFPVFDSFIKEEGKKLGFSTPKTSYILQGPLMAEIFRSQMLAQLSEKKLKSPSPGTVSAPKIYLSGNNVEETKALSRSIFPADPVPVVQTTSFDEPSTKTLSN